MAVEYNVTHETIYHYSDTVPLCQNQGRLTPRKDSEQSPTRRKLEISPTPEYLHHTIDYFGNRITYFDVYQPHDRLSIKVEADVSVHRTVVEPDQESPSWENVREELAGSLTAQGLMNYQFAFPSPQIRRCEAALKYAAETFSPKRPILDCIIELNKRVHKDFTYDTAATTIHTSIEEVFELRRGVCQDLSNVMLACIRSMGLATRYVSGYLRTYPPKGQEAFIGADASHAWVSVFLGPLGWVDFDPTNALIVANEHITLAWGRDYHDVCPVNGLYIGGGSQTLEVAVRVVPLETVA